MPQAISMSVIRISWSADHERNSPPHAAKDYVILRRLQVFRPNESWLFDSQRAMDYLLTNC